MTPELTHKAAIRRNIATRARLAAVLRREFDANGFLEVTTPALIPAPAQEEFIETFPAGGGFLRPSPELEMKELLAAGYERIYQLGPCWRAGEYGSRHRAEFTMLEYYVAGFDYMALARFTAAMIEAAALELNGSTIVKYRGGEFDLAAASAEFLTVEEAYRRFTGRTAAEALASGDFDELMVVEIEPRLGRGRQCYLIDYPAERAALARRSVENPLASERWELYIGGMELANAFGELTDAAEQRARFAQAAEFRRSQGMQSYPVAERFFAALEQGLPDSAGCALGFDRLTMIFADAGDIADVVF